MKHVWVVVYDSHQGHMIECFENEVDARKLERDIRENPQNHDQSSYSEWISCEKVLVQKEWMP